MTERGRSSLVRNTASIAIGPSQAEWAGDGLTIVFDEIAVPLPRRISGRVTLRPTAVTADRHVIDGHGRHVWSPLAPSAAIEVTLDRPALSWRGHGYLDSNWGAEPIADGFRRWDWSRAVMPDGAAILYDGVRRAANEPFSLALRYRRDGAHERFEPGRRHDLGRGFWGVRRFSQADTGQAPRIAEVLEDSPFYSRTVLDTVLCGERVPAIHESLSGDRFRSPIVKAMLPFRMPRRQ